MSGGHGAPVVAMTLLSANILLPKRQVGHAKSLIMVGENFRTLASSGSVQTSPIPQSIRGSGAGVSHVEITPDEKLIIGLVQVGPNMIHSSLTDIVPSIWIFLMLEIASVLKGT